MTEPPCFHLSVRVADVAEEPIEIFHFVPTSQNKNKHSLCVELSEARPGTQAEFFPRPLAGVEKKHTSQKFTTSLCFI